ncbi:hypothetical protein HMPREF0083_04169 [Aneurinibacillus aneurinilyticus ATCC 12856]|uniref:Uncharacterized protein n=1 Tax=Aneurinibacillus aneurinilyticus ATCC 12856 TaxID=649747 RepID=U1WZN4_ANEAE|nr:hypothetical protein HMPREF0083_04169 [Aneurinibacillus aneurinilyticus ATCC 12856]
MGVSIYVTFLFYGDISFVTHQKKPPSQAAEEKGENIGRHLLL